MRPSAAVPMVILLALSGLTVGCPKKNDDSSKTLSKDESKKKKGGKDESSSSGGDDDDKSAADDGEKKGKTASGCKPPATVDGDYTITNGCVVKLKSSIEVKEQGSLTIEKGAKLAFAAGERLFVDGKLVAKGTTDDPIVFTSSDDSPNPGDWAGIIFTDKTKKGTTLDHVKVEYAGKSSGYGPSAVILYGVQPDRVSIVDSTFEHDAEGAIRADNPKTTFTKLEGNTFKDDSKICITAPAQTWTSIGENKCGDQLAHVTNGDFTKTGSWPKLDSAYVVEDTLVIGAEGDAPILTLPDGATLKMGKGVGIQVGEKDGGGIVAKNVDFTSAAVTPDQGDWHNIVFLEKATKSSLDGCTIEYGGSSGGYGEGAIVFNAPVKKLGKRVTITNVKMQNESTGGINAPEGDCGDYDDPSSGNKTDGDPLCKK